MVRRAVMLFLVLVLAVQVGATRAWARDTNPDNKLVDFARFGDWEVWCIRLAATGEVLCDLDNVLNYSPDPDFRATIPRVYLDAAGRPYIEIEREWQTSFERGFLQVAGHDPYPLAGCGDPCRIEGADAEAQIALLAGGGRAVLRLHDYVVEAFDVAIDLAGFAEGLAALRDFQAKYRP